MNIITQVLSALILIPRQPNLLAERSQIVKGTKSWDRFFTPAITIFGTLANIVIASLDARFHWTTSINLGIWISAVIIAELSQLFVFWAMASNQFFATTVRIQEERGHYVVETGPYCIIRHPGYAGSVIYSLLIPLVLGSYWTFFPAILTVGLLITRTKLEDGTLQAELPGYNDYAQRISYRLIPGI